MIEAGFRNNLAHRRPLLEPPTQRHRDRAAHAHQEGHHRASRGWCGGSLTRANAGIPGDGGWPWMDQQWRVVHRQQQGEDGGVQEALHHGQGPWHRVAPSQPWGDQGRYETIISKEGILFLKLKVQRTKVHVASFHMCFVAPQKILSAPSPNFYWMRIFSASLPSHECGWHLWNPL